MLLIRNTNDFVHRDRYDGKDFVFPIGEAVQVPEEAAHHFFGYGEDDKLPFLTRAGWVRNSEEFERGQKILNGFVFMDAEVIVRPLELEQIPDTPDTPEPPPAPPQEPDEPPVAKKKGKKNTLVKIAELAANQR
jgi:hypothetical protein